MSDFDPEDLIDGRYRVLSRVGAGGMADVYLAEDEQLGREVALKLLHRRFAADPGFVERFRREAQAAASLQHPNVVSVFDRGSFDGTYYIAMEYLPGRSLKQLIREEAPLTPERAIELTVQILKAARFAHRRGVIHRDLKPHNVIIDENDHAKVTDFGIARAGASDMTETGSIMGTAQYLSPEQAQGHAVSAPSDLYSVAVMLYEMLTGRVPFDGESPVSIALKHVSEAPLPPSQLNSAIPPALEQVVLWSLNKNPADRPADADQLIEALEQVRLSISGEATASMPAVGSVGYVEGAATSAPQTVVVPPAQAAASYGGARELMNGDRFDRYDDDEPTGDGRGPWPWIVALMVLVAIAGGVLAFLLTRPTMVVVPNVTTLKLQIAEQKLQNLGFTVTVVPLAHREPAETVIGQHPLANAKVAKGSTIQLNVSTGPGTVSIPTVAQLPKAEAIQRLKSAGLVVSPPLTETSTTVPKGYAIKTDPPAGTAVTSGNAVTLYISSGKPAKHKPKKIRVPDVKGDTLATAQQALSNFSPHVVYKTTTAASPDTVLAQSPSPRTLVAPGSTVTLTVAAAPQKVPDVIGFTESAAVSALKADGYNVKRTYQDVKSQSREGNVIAQSPKQNSTLNKGKTVTIVIGRYTGAGNSGTTTASTTPSTTPATSTTP